MNLGNSLQSLPAWLAAVALATAGCVGHVDRGHTSGPSGPSSGPGTTSSGATQNGTVAPPGAGTGTGTIPGMTSIPGAGSGTANGSGAVPGAGTTTSPSSGPRDPGRVLIRQLNSREYDNTVRDLLGTAQQPGLTFLNDEPSFAFDNDAGQQLVSPVQAGLYQQAAESLAAEAITGANRAKLITCDLAIAGDTCGKSIITTFGAKAYRRPLTTAEVTNYLALMAAARTAGATADVAVRTAVEAFLQSPIFLFRPETEADPTSLTPHTVGPYEMASRLSYLLYRSMPDQVLFDAAAAGKLAAPADVLAQLTRMLADPKATFSQDFSAQWIGARSLESIQFDITVFPKFTPVLAASMKSELTSFFDDFVKENLPVNQLLTANFSYIDSTLATHYGLPAVGSGGVKKTTLNSPQRGGLFTMAGPLAVTSYMTRTSLVKRGAWIMSQFLCQDPPPPPNNVPPLPTDTVMGTQRQILEMHRAAPSCAGCHVIMDNLGMALENYDGIGAWRTTDTNGAAIDANGMLGTATFNGGKELSAVIAADPRLAPCVSRKMLGYALGRIPLASDEPYVGDLAAGTSSGPPGVRDILTRLVASDPFNMTHGAP